MWLVEKGAPGQILTERAAIDGVNTRLASDAGTHIYRRWRRSLTRGSLSRRFSWKCEPEVGHAERPAVTKLNYDIRAAYDITSALLDLALRFQVTATG